MRLCTREQIWGIGKRKTTLEGNIIKLAGKLFIFFCCWLLVVGVSGFQLSYAEGKGALVPTEEGSLFQSEQVAVYVVKKGDRLSDLAQRFYGDPEKTWIIEEANEDLALDPGEVLVIPLRPTNPGGLSVDGYQVVSILTYHHFGNQCTNTLCMPIEEFSRQMAFLKKEGYRTVTMKEVLKFIDYQEPLPRKAVAITIDDGYRSAYELAYPILKQYNFKATLFIYTDFIDGSPNAITWEQLRELTKAGFETTRALWFVTYPTFR